MHTRFFYAILWLVALIIWTIFNWLTGTSHSEIEERFSFTEGKPIGAYHYISIYPSVYFGDVSWYDKYRDTFGEGAKKEVAAIAKSYRDKMQVYLDTLKELNPEKWDDIIAPYDQDILLGDTILNGERVTVKQKADISKAVFFKVEGSELLFEIDDDLVGEFEKELVGLEVNFKGEEYYRFAEALNVFLSSLDYVKVMHRHVDTTSNNSLKMAEYVGKSVYRIYDADDDLIVEDKGLMEAVATKFDKDEFGDRIIVENEDYLLWYKQWSYQWVAGIMVFMVLIQIYGGVRLMFRKPKYIVHIDDAKEVFKFRIGSRKQIEGPFEIPIAQLRVVSFIQDTETNDGTLLAIVFFYDAENSEDSVYYHFFMQDYKFDETHSKLEELPKDKIFTAEVENFNESTSENKIWTFKYTLKDGEELEFQGSYYR